MLTQAAEGPAEAAVLAGALPAAVASPPSPLPPPLPPPPPLLLLRFQSPRAWVTHSSSGLSLLADAAAARGGSGTARVSEVAPATEASHDSWRVEPAHRANLL